MRRLAAVLFAAALLAGGLALAPHPASGTRALQRAERYAAAVNRQYKTPQKIYSFLCGDFRAEMTESAFCQAFEKERSYPYITPLYLFDPEVEMSADGTEATVVYKQAARISGMTYRVRLLYENGDYYVEDWSELLDGSYLEKFKHIPYSLDWYYDVGKLSQEGGAD